MSLAQLTDTNVVDFSTDAAISDDGTRIAFQSSTPLVGNNDGGNLEIYLFDTLANSTTQVTEAASGDSTHVSISRDGARLAFQSNADLTGQNADGNLEIFLFDVPTGILTQVTDTSGATSSGAALNGDGTRIAFESTADLAGSNADGNFEILLFDTVTGDFTQVTDTNAADSTSAAVNGDGTRIAFSSTADLTGGNPEGNAELFLFDATTSSLTQVTNATAGDSTRPSIDAAGTRVAFESTADLVGQNADGNREIFWFDASTSNLDQLTSSATDIFFPGDASHASISSDGTKIAYDSVVEEHFEPFRRLFVYDITRDEYTQATSGYDTPFYDAAPAINGDGTRMAFETHEVHESNVSVGLFTFNPESLAVSLTTQIPSLSSTFASISADGSRVAFESNGDQAGHNADRSREIFRADTATGMISQATNAPRPLDPYGDSASSNLDGTWVAFSSSANLTGTNADGNREIFLFNVAANNVIQVTNSAAGDSFNPSISSDGTRIAFESSADPLGQNADGNREIFLYDVTASSLTQVTVTTGQGTYSVGASLSDDGVWIAFDSTADLTGQNTDGNREIFLYDVGGAVLTQVTETLGGPNSGASINADGTRIAFDSYADFTGHNADGNREIFLYDVTSATFTQVTVTVRGASSDASINGDGTKIALQSTADPLGTNADGNHEIFLYGTALASLTQITQTTGLDSYRPSISTDGKRIAFDSLADLTVPNDDFNYQVFLFDVTLGSLTQITNVIGEDGYSFLASGYRTSLSGDGAQIAYTSGGDVLYYNTHSTIVVVYPATGESTAVPSVPAPASIDSSDASISADGSRIAFQSRANLTGENAEGHLEVFFYDDATDSVTQVTNAAGLHSQDPSMSGDGGTVAFQSQADLTGQNADGSFEIFVYDVAMGVLTQVTGSTSGASSSVSINGDGTRLTFVSSANLTGMNADGNDEIFVFDTAAGGFIQVTNTTGASNRTPSISGDGTRIAFASNANLTGHNADGNREVYLFDVNTNSIAQITDTTGKLISNPAISSDGTKIVFSSTANLTGNNADGNSEFFVFDATTNSFTQVTATTGGVNGSRASINSDGTKVAFHSGANLTGENSDGNDEIFLATLVDAVQDVHLFFNNSVIDGNGPAVTEADFQAIATDKAPLPFGAKATFSNVSGYSRGINGLFIDVPDLPDDGAAIDAGDLRFTVGTDDFPGAWGDAPAPTSLGVFPNAAPGGADRIYVTFADRAIVDTWLGITILATADTGLADAATFFYGSVPGETGAAFVGQGQFFGRDAADLQAVAIDLFHAAGVDNPNDLNRDGRVDAFDLQVIPVAGAGRIQPNVLGAITPQAGPPPFAGVAGAAVDEVVAVDVFAVDDVSNPPGGDSLGDFYGPVDERVSGEEPTDRDLAFAMFADAKTNRPLPRRVISTLMVRRISL